MAGLRDSLRVVWDTALPLALATAIVLPVLRIDGASAVTGPLTAGLRQISIQQEWRMYSPDPQRAHTYIGLWAEYADGSRVALPEAVQAENTGWGTIWGWQKTRIDIWRFYAALKPDKPNAHRTWYLRAACVREALAGGEPPRKIIAERRRRSFTPPDRVRAGKPDLGPLERYPLQTVDCQTWPVRDMIADARARRAP